MRRGGAMSVDNWYRNAQWNGEIAERFEARLKRARGKAQYLRIQAGYLAPSEPLVALQLLGRYFELGADVGHAQAFVDRAVAYVALGQIENAVESYEQALQRETESPGVQTPEPWAGW